MDLSLANPSAGKLDPSNPFALPPVLTTVDSSEPVQLSNAWSRGDGLGLARFFQETKLHPLKGISYSFPNNRPNNPFFPSPGAFGTLPPRRRRASLAEAWLGWRSRMSS